MKKVKFIAAFAAITLAIVGSAFKFAPKDYGFISVTGSAGNWHYTVADMAVLDANSVPYSCESQNNKYCKVNLDILGSQVTNRVTGLGTHGEIITFDFSGTSQLAPIQNQNEFVY